MSAELPRSLEHDSRLLRSPSGDYYLCFGVKRPPGIHVRDNACLRIISADPGCRTAWTFYDPDGYLIEVGADDNLRLRKMGHAEDILKSRIAKHKKIKESSSVRHVKQTERRKLRRMSAALIRRREDTRNKIDEVHKKVVHFLDQNYDLIIIPNFGVKDMVKRDKRKIHKKTVRDMLTWSHGAFRQRLKMRVGEDRLPDCKEDYTSKTCVSCGKLNHTLGGQRVFKCKECGLVIGRDGGGSVGILLKNLSLTRFLGTPVQLAVPGMGLGPFSS